MRTEAASHRPLRNHISSTEGQDVDGGEPGLAAGRNEHNRRLGGRVLHDGVVHWFGHGQQARLSVTHVEALREEGEEEEEAVVNMVSSQGRKASPSPHTPGCAAPGARASRWGGN